MCLTPRRGCSCWSRSLLCARQSYFAFLPPGEYLLTLEADCRRLELLVRLPPGANVEVLWEAGHGVWRWRRECCPTFFNQT